MVLDYVTTPFHKSKQKKKIRAELINALGKFILKLYNTSIIIWRVWPQNELYAKFEDFELWSFWDTTPQGAAYGKTALAIPRFYLPISA